MQDRLGDDDAYDDAYVSEVIRPAAVVPEDAAREILVELALDDVGAGGHWRAEPSRWSRYDRPWTSATDPGGAVLVGILQVAYGTPTRYEITIYRVTITTPGAALGWTVVSLSDDALGLGGLTLDDCPRASLAAPPKPFRF